MAVAGSLHFLMASIMWSLLIYIAVRDEWPQRPILWEALPAYLLLACFGVTSLAALGRRRIAGWLLVAGLLCSAGVFAHDRATKDYILRTESYAEGRGMYQYPTWWWYDWR